MNTNTHASVTTATTNDGPMPTLRRLLAILPDAIDTAMRETLPDWYTPERAREIADRMAADLREDATTNTAGTPADGSRTITYPIRSGGSLTHTCPAWCEYDHTDDVAHGIAVEDLFHQGDKVSLDHNADGIEGSILQARIAQWPYSADPDDVVPYIEFTPEGSTGASIYCRNRLELDDEIRRVRAHLHALVELGDRLAEAQADDHHRHATAGGGQPWASLSRTDLQSLPIAYLLKVFGVTVVESDEPMGTTTLVLGGQPGDMLLLLNPQTPQHIREDATRTALLDWYDARTGGAA